MTSPILKEYWSREKADVYKTPAFPPSILSDVHGM